MANLKRLQNAIKKAGLTIEPSGHGFKVQGVHCYGEFFVQGDQAVCISTCPNGQQSDSMTDYFPQTFHDTIKGFVFKLSYSNATMRLKLKT